MRFGKLALLVVALAVLGLPPAQAAEPYRLRIGWIVAGADLATMMFAKPELAPHAGKSSASLPKRIVSSRSLAAMLCRTD